MRCCLRGPRPRKLIAARDRRGALQAMTIPSSPSFDEHAQPAARRDGRAVEQLVRATYSDVWRLCAVLVDEQVADDLAQETFLRATRSLRRFRGDSTPRTWILAIARHVCMDELRGRHRAQASRPTPAPHGSREPLRPMIRPGTLRPTSCWQSSSPIAERRSSSPSSCASATPKRPRCAAARPARSARASPGPGTI